MSELADAIALKILKEVLVDFNDADYHSLLLGQLIKPAQQVQVNGSLAENDNDKQEDIQENNIVIKQQSPNKDDTRASDNKSIVPLIKIKKLKSKQLNIRSGKDILSQVAFTRLPVEDLVVMINQVFAKDAKSYARFANMQSL